MLYEKKLIGLFTHNFLLWHPNSQKIEGILNKGLRKVCTSCFLCSSRRHQPVLFLHRIAESVSRPNLYILLTPLFLSSSSVFLSYFVLAIPMRECLGKHSCMSSPISYSHTEWYTFFFSPGEISCLCESFVYQNQIKINETYFLILFHL